MAQTRADKPINQANRDERFMAVSAEIMVQELWPLGRSPCRQGSHSGSDPFSRLRFGRLTIAGRRDCKVSMSEHELPADRLRIAPERIHGRVGLTAILQSAQGC